MVGERHLPRHRHVAPADHPRIRNGVVGARHGRVVTMAVRAPVRPTTRWMRVVSRASARVIAGRMVVSRRASLDVPAPRGRAGGHDGQNACMIYRFTSASRDAHGPAAEPAREAASPVWGHLMTFRQATPSPPRGRRQSPRRTSCRAAPGAPEPLSACPAVATAGSGSSPPGAPRI
jgi:hypothetical protein